MNRLASDTYQRELNKLCMENLPYEKFQNKSILITGATGLIGSYLTDFFLYLNREKQIGLKVFILCRNVEKAERQFSIYREEKNFTILSGDLTQSIEFQEEFDYVIHGAGNNHPVAFHTEPVETMKAALLGTMNLLDQCVQQKQRKRTEVSQFLFLSTGEVYGEVDEIGPSGCREEETGKIDPMNPRSCYPEAKRAAETLCVSYGQEYGLDTRIARLSYIYGGNFQKESSKADVQFLKKALAGEDIVMKSSGLQFRSYCYLQDAVKGILYNFLLYTFPSPRDYVLLCFLVLT